MIGSVRAPTTAPTPWAVTSHVVPIFPECRAMIAIAGTRVMKGLATSGDGSRSPAMGLRQPFTLPRPPRTRPYLGEESHLGGWHRPMGRAHEGEDDEHEDE